MEDFKRTEMLLGTENMNKLSNVHILIVGVGGVGGYVAEMLVRSGVGKITIVDHDNIDVTNINRQIIALKSTLGQPKVYALKNRLCDINPKIQIDAIYKRFCKETVNEILNKNFDYVIDAIDSIKDKTLLVVEAKKRNFNIISALGTGNRIAIPKFEITDIYKTFNDGLSKSFRKLLRENKIDSLDVVFSSELPCQIKIETVEKKVGSIVYSPVMCGATISAFVINKLILK